MRLSTKSRFAVTAMIDLGLRQHLGPVSLAAISQRQHISISYLEQIFSKMRQQGLVDSTRGPGGGYTLVREARDISVADIIAAVSQAEDQEPLGISGEASISTDALWSNLNQKMEDHMRTISLQSLIAQQQPNGLPVAEVSSPKRGVFAQKRAAAPAANIPNSVFALGRALAGGQ